jgi:hypothetical protein
MLRSLSPILIASPVHRSGTTLLQRLLCSSPDTLIFGETLANDLNFFCSMLHNKNMLMGGQDNWRAKQLEQVLQGDVNEWIPDIMPDKDWVLKHFEKSLADYLNAFASLAKEKNRVYWGTKLPGWQPPLLASVFRYMPNSKLLYIIRDLDACVRSAKLIGYCHTPADVEQFAQFWQMNQRSIKTGIPAQQVLIIDYQQLCDQPATVLPQIQTFTGIQAIDPTVLNHRINNYNRMREEPPQLTTEERAIIEKYQVGFSSPLIN